MTPSTIQLAGSSFEVHSLCDAAPGKGHDAVLLRPEFVAVADGSTPLDGSPADAVRDFTRAALEQLHARRAMDARAMFAGAVTALAASRHATIHSTCAVALARGQAGRLAVAVLGDCTVIVKLRDDRADVLCDDRVARLDRRVVVALRQRLAAGMAYDQAISELAPMLLAHRRLHNVDGGYWVLCDDPRAADQVLSRSYPVDAVEALLLCTDGLTRLVVPFGWARSYPDLLDRARRHGLEHLVGRLRAVEGAPDSLLRHPRLGLHDDVGAVLLVRAAPAAGASP